MICRTSRCHLLFGQVTWGRLDMNKKVKKTIKIIASLLGIVFVILAIIAKRTKKDTVYENNPEEKNPMEGKKVIFVESEDDTENADGVKGHLEVVEDSEYHPGFYEKHVKRLIDIVLSFAGLVVLSPVFAAITIAIKIEDPGPVLFVQKRVGQNKQYFKLHKFRSMKVSTPHDVPTHMLENPEQYITKVGAFIRRHSLDELPQIWDIFVGNLSTIGPRPGLWNQDLLTAERDKYGANDVKPGLTGWAQINGRDELEILEKAKLDGEYIRKLSLGMDIKCFLGSLHVIGKDESVVEGGSGKVKKYKYKFAIPEEILVSVVIATYRREDALRNALQSLTTQSYKNFEVVLVDDNSNLNWNARVLEIVNDFSKRLNINYITNERNIGSAATRNRGIEAAKGDYITFLDDDDIYLPEKIEMQLKDMISSGADYGITDLYLYSEKGDLIDKRIRSYIKATKRNDLMRYHLLYHMTGTDTFMFRTEYLRQIGGFPDIDVGDEFYLMAESILGGGKFIYSDHCYIKAYVHLGESNGLSSGESKINGENMLFQEKKKYFDYLSKKDRKYVEMRHYAVIAFAEMRRKNKYAFMVNAFKAFITSPVSCVKILLEHR